MQKNNDYRKYDLNAANSFLEGARLVTMFLVMNIIMIINIVMLIWCFSFFLSLFFFFFFVVVEVIQFLPHDFCLCIYIVTCPF